MSVQHDVDFNYTTDTDVSQEMLIASGVVVQILDAVTVRITLDEVLTDSEEVKLFER